MARLDQALVARGLMPSRARAQAEIAAGTVLVNGTVVQKAAAKISETDVLTLSAPSIPYVSRAGLKLAGALDVFDVKVQGRQALDLGASTGGFVEVLLAHGAAHVVAVDVGHGQLHEKVASDARVSNLEGTDARNLAADMLPYAPDLITTDMSFISLTKALQPALDLAAPGADLIALVKPQFEVGRANIGRGGIVKDEAARQKALSDVRGWIEQQGWSVAGTADSPIKGSDGNAEFLLHARKEKA